MAEAFVYVGLAVVIVFYFALEVYMLRRDVLAQRNEPSVPELDGMKKEIDELKSKVDSITLRDGFKLR